MDFIALAQSSHAIVRLLTEASGGTNEDDDFANLENISHDHDRLEVPSSSTTTTFGALLSPDDQQSPMSSSSSSSYTAASSSTQFINTSRPLLSPTAEQELLSLSTNFLLYTAMVVIVTLVAQIYFPSCLEPREPIITTTTTTTTTTTARKTTNRERSATTGRRKDSVQEKDGFDFDEEEEDEDGVEGRRGGHHLDSVVEEGDDDDDDNEVAGLLLNRSSTKSMSATDILSSPGRPTRAGSLLFMREENNNSSFLNELMDENKKKSRESVYTNLAICAIMLNLTFVSWGLLQERMLTRRYPRLTGEYFTYSYALVFTNRFWTLIMSGMLLVYFKPRRSHSTVIYDYCLPSISNLLSSWCQYEALRYVSFPAVTLFKSFKLAPVMLMGKLLGNYSYPQYDYIVAIFIGIGITMFMTSTDELTFDFDVYGEQSSAKWTGVMLLLFFLFFDSFTSQWQSRMFKRHRDLSMIELMFATSAFSTALSLITLLHDGMLWPAFEFIGRHSEIQFHFFIFSICSTVGQLFIFYTIKNFGAVVFAIIMTTRVLISIALSVSLYQHKVTSTGFFGLVVVVAAVCYRIKRKAEGRQLIKWEGMGEKSEKEIELVQEWHEHIDT